MKIESYTRGAFTVLLIEQEDDSIQELFELQDVIDEYLRTGIRNIAVKFSNISYVYSGEIRVLISCFKLVQKHNGRLLLLEPKRAVYDVLVQMNIDKVIAVLMNEEDLPTE